MLQILPKDPSILLRCSISPFRLEGDAYTQYKAMIICTGQHLLLLMFELLACAKLQSATTHVLWVLVFIPLVFMAIVSLGICVWAVKHERTFEVWNSL